MIQEIAPHKLDNHFRPGQVPEDGDSVFVFSGESVMCRAAEKGILFPRAGEVKADDALTYLFDVDGKRYFLAEEGSICLPAGYEFVPLRSLRRKDVPDKHLIFAAITARHLNDWYRTVRFCGCCGQRLRPSETERAMVCPSCGQVFYPRINPAVIVGVTHGDHLLLTRYAGRRLSSYALVAGFAEIGETLEETVAREVMEETGLAVTNIRYYKSQPWGYAADILTGYYCDVTGDPTIHMDRSELKEAVWMARADIPGQADDFSLTNEMMCAFRDGKIG